MPTGDSIFGDYCKLSTSIGPRNGFAVQSQLGSFLQLIPPCTRIRKPHQHIHNFLRRLNAAWRPKLPPLSWTSKLDSIRTSSCADHVPLVAELASRNLVGILPTPRTDLSLTGASRLRWQRRTFLRLSYSYSNKGTSRGWWWFRLRETGCCKQTIISYWGCRPRLTTVWETRNRRPRLLHWR